MGELDVLHLFCFFMSFSEIKILLCLIFRMYCILGHITKILYWKTKGQILFRITFDNFKNGEEGMH